MDVSIVSPALQDEILAAQKRIAELEAALSKIVAMQSDDEPYVPYSSGQEYFKRARTIAREALEK